MFRDDAFCFVQDALALELARSAVKKGQDLEFPIDCVPFVYAIHSEWIKRIHEIAVPLFESLGFERTYEI